jgi:hypothetical protein
MSLRGQIEDHDKAKVEEKAKTDAIEEVAGKAKEVADKEAEIARVKEEEKRQRLSNGGKSVSHTINESQIILILLQVCLMTNWIRC